MSNRADEVGGAADVPRETSNINISGDTVKQALGDLLRREEISVEQEGLIWWFYCHSRTEGFDLKEAARQIGKDTTTLYRVWSGKYGASLDNICQDIARYRKLAEERSTRVKLDFVETSVWKTISDACNIALVSQRPVFIWGDSQSGKTTCLEEYARRNNHGQTKYMRMPASAGVQLFMKEMARACFVSPESCFEKLRERVFRAIDDKTLLIIDELHQVFTTYQHGSTIKVMEVIREIWDRTHCGLVLCGTNVLREEMMRGKVSPILDQLNRRASVKVPIPASPPQKDLTLIARKFGLPAADGIAAEIVKDMIHKSGLGMYIQFLHMAGMMAAKAGKPLSWDHFVQAHDIIARLSSKQ